MKKLFTIFFFVAPIAFSFLAAIFLWTNHEFVGIYGASFIKRLLQSGSFVSVVSMFNLSLVFFSLAFFILYLWGPARFPAITVFMAYLLPFAITFDVFAVTHMLRENFGPMVNAWIYITILCLSTVLGVFTMMMGGRLAGLYKRSGVEKDTEAPYKLEPINQSETDIPNPGMLP